MQLHIHFWFSVGCPLYRHIEPILIPNFIIINAKSFQILFTLRTIWFNKIVDVLSINNILQIQYLGSINQHLSQLFGPDGGVIHHPYSYVTVMIRQCHTIPEDAGHSRKVYLPPCLKWRKFGLWNNGQSKKAVHILKECTLESWGCWKKWEVRVFLFGANLSCVRHIWRKTSDVISQHRHPLGHSWIEKETKC